MVNVTTKNERPVAAKKEKKELARLRRENERLKKKLEKAEFLIEIKEKHHGS